MQDHLTLRLARPADLAAVDVLLARSYPRLLKPDYPPSIMVTLVPMLARARPELLASGRYFVVEGRGRVLGAGGYSLAAPGLRGAAPGAEEPRLGHIRHLATDPDATRQGIARRLMEAVFAAATGEAVAQFECLSTRTAVTFYQAMGFQVIGPVDIPLGPGMSFPAVRMQRGA